MSKTEVVENLIIGSGLAGIATGMALHRLQAPFAVIDIGYDLDPVTEKSVAQLAQSDPSGWDGEVRKRLFPPPVTSASGVERRLLFGSDFPYRIPDAFSVKMEECMTELSHGLGGFGNVWGAAMLPYSDHSLRNWPLPIDKLKESYRNVLQYVPLSAEKDELQNTFPIYSDRTTTLDRSKQINALLNAFNRRKASFRKKGVEFGRARVAVNSTGDASSCRYCGLCLDGCVYGSIFSPRLLWKRIEADKKLIHRGFYALEFKEHDDDVLVTALNMENGSIKQWRTKRLFLASGHFATARMIARSLGRFNEVIRIADSQYFFFPLLSYQAVSEGMRFSLVDMFVEILNDELSSDYVHFQLYGMNPIFLQTLQATIPRPIPLKPITSRLYIFQGYLPSQESGHLELSVVSAGAKGDEVVIRGVENPRALPVAKKAQALLRKSLLTFGIIPPFYLQLLPPGRSFHTGGSFPIGGSHHIYSSDTLGRPAGLKRVHIVDSANFPDVASSTIGFTIMANADRIVNACAEFA